MRHQRLALPFLNTITAATLVAGCGSTVVVEGDSGSGGASTSTSTATTTASTTSGVGGGQPVPECPPEKPEHDSVCTGFGEGQACPYLSDWPCPSLPVDATCKGGRWEVEQPLCNPPPPRPCEDYEDANLCDGDPSCRWIVPGCGDFPLDQPQCFPVDDCMPGQCPQDSQCVEVSHDLCWNSLCNACSVSVFVCLGDDSDV